MNNSVVELTRWEWQVVALASVAQSAALVAKLALHGNASQTEILASVNPLLVLNPSSEADVYPNLGHLNLGLRTLDDMFNQVRSPENVSLVRYTLGMLLLRNKLDANPNMQAKIRDRLQSIQPLLLTPENATPWRMEETEKTDEQMRQEQTFEQIAALYQDTISTLAQRIQVQGQADYLQNEYVSNRVRSLLLAGIRSAVLWHQLGGRRWRLIFYRKRVQETASRLRRRLLTSI
ncbi:MAG: high frequency lysogenization protein HflD [Gammaproteobacteria bacterium]|nr:high frequency lysogenization protein HflD [Gammaproteobacteria bacterium]